jgi:hypothetical protein
MLAREHHPFGCARLKPSLASVPAGLTLASDFSFCFQCQAGSNLVLRRPIETTRLIGHWAAIALRFESGVVESRLRQCGRFAVFNSKSHRVSPLRLAVFVYHNDFALCLKRSILLVVNDVFRS